MFSDTDCDIRSGLTLLPAARLTVAKRKAGLSLWTNAKALPTNVNFQKAKEYVSLLVFLGFLCIRGGNHLFFESTSFLSLCNFDKTPTFSRVFHQIFMTIFLVKSKLSTAKKSKTTTFSRIFHPKNRQFSQEIKVEFLDKK